MQLLVNALFFAFLTIVPAFCWPINNDNLYQQQQYDENIESNTSMDLRKLESELDSIFADEVKDLADIKPRVQEDINEFEDKLQDLMSNDYRKPHSRPRYYDYNPYMQGKLQLEYR